MLNDEKLINRIVNTCYELQKIGNTKLPTMTNRLKQIEKELDNIMTAIKQGIFSPTIKDSLDALEKEKSNLELAIAKEKIERPLLSKEQIKCWICKFKLINRSSDVQKQQLIDVFVNAIYVYDDKLLITYNYKDGEKCISYSEIQEYLNKKENTDNHKDYQCSPLTFSGTRSGVRTLDTLIKSLLFFCFSLLAKAFKDMLKPHKTYMFCLIMVFIIN